MPGSEAVSPDPPGWLTWAEVTFGGVGVLGVLTMVAGLALALAGEWIRRGARNR
ncbi:MAG: hypothetical protein R3199_10375 [Gemmatimonadota bacterium]|nr:hypothetical protein [Gemmatimonadota bacterium]